MMWPYYAGPGSALMFLGGLLTWLLFAVIVVVAVRAFAQGRPHGDSALDVLRRRLAAGEITPEEYEKTRRMLEG